MLPASPDKEHITIRLYVDILECFRGECERAGGGKYQTAINNVLREHLQAKKHRTSLTRHDDLLSCEGAVFGYASFFRAGSIETCTEASQSSAAAVSTFESA